MIDQRLLQSSALVEDVIASPCDGTSPFHVIHSPLLLVISPDLFLEGSQY
jgi:hypothetical protein